MPREKVRCVDMHFSSGWQWMEVSQMERGSWSRTRRWQQDTHDPSCRVIRAQNTMNYFPSLLTPSSSADIPPPSPSNRNPRQPYHRQLRRRRAIRRLHRLPRRFARRHLAPPRPQAAHGTLPGVRRCLSNELHRPARRCTRARWTWR